MKKVFTLILALAFGFGLKAQCPYTQAIDFTATDCHGTELHLFDILDSGQAVLIDFFYTTCGPCQQATPKIAQSYTAMGCNMYDVFYMEITPYDADPACQTWVNNYGIEYPTIGTTGGGSTITSQYGIGAFPTVILIMPNHEIVIQDLWPINNAQTIITQLEAHGLQQHDCNTPSYDPQVALTIDDVTETSITATFTPNEDCAIYYYVCATEAQIMEWIALGDDYVTMLNEHGISETTTLTTTFNDLTPETEYYVIALPFDPDGNYGEPVYEAITTLPQQVIVYDPQISIAINEVTENSITATFTPNEDCASYYYLITTEDELTEWVATLGEDLVAIMEEHGNVETATLTNTFNDLFPETEYHVIALPADPDGNYGEPVYETVVTMPHVVYDETLTFSMDTVYVEAMELAWITVYNYTAEEATVVKIVDEYESLSFTLDGEEMFFGSTPTAIIIPQGESIELGIYLDMIAKDVVADAITLSGNLPDASFIAMVNFPESVEENEAALSLFPNPANESVTLKGESLGMVRVFNLLGQKVDEIEANGTEVRINTAGYENGIYFVKAGEQTLRFVVKH